MTTLYDSPLLRSRLRRAGAEMSSGGSRQACDCKYYAYLSLALVLFFVGAAVTALALGDADGRLFNHLGHAWLVGPVFICAATMVAVKSMLYLRRKTLVQMLLRQQAAIRSLAVARAASPERVQVIPVAIAAAAAASPPPYESCQTCQAPPPSYEEAMLLKPDDRTFHTDKP